MSKSVLRSRIAGVGLASLLCAAAALRGETADPIPGWLAAVDRVRNAFTEAIITARASQVAGGNVTGSADFQIYTKGEDRGLIVFRGGKNDGRKILNVGQKMWLMVPGASRALPITPNQRLLGGASIGDVARVEFSKDYTAALRPEREEVGGRNCRVLDLTSKSESSPYPRVVLWFDDKERVPCRLLFSLPSGKKAKDVLFKKFQKAAGQTVVEEMEIRDLVAGDTGTVTRLEYVSIAPAKIDDRFFTPEGALNF